MSTSRAEKKLLKLSARHEEVLAGLLKIPEMLRGSFGCISTRCGKATCWCAQGAYGHRHNRITWSDHGKMTTRKVPEKEIERIKELTGNYRRFKKDRRELVKIQKELLMRLTRLEETIDKQTRNPLRYLARNPQTEAKTGKPLRKAPEKKK